MRLRDGFIGFSLSLTLSMSAAFGPCCAFAAPPAVRSPKVKPPPEMATDPTSTATEPVFKENIFTLYFKDLYSPFVNPTTLSLLAGGTVSTLTLLATANNFENQVLANAAEARPLGDSSHIGDIMGQMVPNIAYFVYFAGDYFITKDPLAEFRAELMFRATLAATSFSTVLKAVVREPRPRVPNELTSFPSGHSTSIFAFATDIAALHGPYWGGAAYALATFVAFSRMNDDRHRLHDVVAGATIGSMYGLSVYERMRNASLPSIKTAQSFHYEIMPVAVDDGAMLGLSATF